ncbi:hypothetical protein SAMN05421840_102105 [Shewanella morhuae]|uniref:Uncharacterized protein n=1 Tax=Shewanella morhuae TaxID=365591 RepID=A0A1N6TQ95_9GAMM|nr:hypothetical protein SAMN05421840_102105 [Shewanella morhuae]SUI61373.1 Uncharacterised protein [Shewanella morhuae]
MSVVLNVVIFHGLNSSGHLAACDIIFEQVAAPSTLNDYIVINPVFEC